MAEKPTVSKKGSSADWLVRGVLTKLGDSFDKLTGRKWAPTSSLAASELIERIKKLLDAEAKEVPGKGKVVPHNIKLKMQWNKFSEDAEDAIRTLQVELMTAAIDHINDSLYYTYAPVTLEVRPDYFIEGVKLAVSFDDFVDDEGGVEMNVTIPAINVADALSQVDAAAAETYIARYELKAVQKEKQLIVAAGQSLSVGRISANAFVIDDNSVSKTHASLALAADGSLMVADTGSTNGTFINDERIAYGKAVKAAPSDRIKFGTVEVTFERMPGAVDGERDKDAVGQPDDTVSIDGFEFKSRVPQNLPECDRSPEAPVADETLKIIEAAKDDKTPDELRDVGAPDRAATIPDEDIEGK